MPNSMHCHNALSTSTPAPLHHKALERPLNVVVARVLAEALVGQIGSSLKERICNLLVHGRMVQRGFGFFNSHFPSPDSFVYDCTLVVDKPGRNTEIQSFQG